VDSRYDGDVKTVGQPLMRCVAFGAAVRQFYLSCWPTAGGCTAPLSLGAGAVRLSDFQLHAFHSTAANG